MVRIRILGRDRPGELARICQDAASVGANILEVRHNRAFGTLQVGGVEIDLIMETRGRDHVEQLLNVFRENEIEAEEVI
jgi:threonine dehydratase